jgi:hypothetical protein
MRTFGIDGRHLSGSAKTPFGASAQDNPLLLGVFSGYLHIVVTTKWKMTYDQFGMAEASRIPNNFGNETAVEKNSGQMVLRQEGYGRGLQDCQHRVPEEA